MDHRSREREPTREAQVRQDGVLPLRHVAGERQVDVQQDEGHTRQEADDADADGVVTRRVVLVEDALRLGVFGGVDVALRRDAGEHHQGKQLRGTKGSDEDNVSVRPAGDVWNQWRDADCWRRRRCHDKLKHVAQSHNSEIQFKPS